MAAAFRSPVRPKSVCNSKYMLTISRNSAAVPPP